VKLAAAFACAAMTFIGPVAFAQQFRIGVIDFYGLQKLSAEELRPHLTIAEGDPISLDDENWGAPFAQTQQQLSRVAGVFRAHVNGFVCCTDGKAEVFIGIEERGAHRWHFRKPPRGTVRLPQEIVASGAEFTDASTVAMARGDFDEDRSAGHSLAHAPEVRRVQLQFVEHARRHLDKLREVLRQDADADERALAAQVIAYTSDKQVVVADLVRAIRDPYEHVRNNAMRALAVFTEKESSDGAPAIEVPFEPFVALLGSPIWTDRNKSLFALESLSVKRNPKLLRLLRREALAPLSEMARWKAPGRTLPPLKILGRMAGYSEEEIASAIEQGRQEELIAAATRVRWQPPVPESRS